MKKFLAAVVLLCASAVGQLCAWSGMEMPALHIEGRYLCDEQGNHVNLHGYGQTYSPWFNEQGSKWSNYNVTACLNYNKGLIDAIDQHGWKANWLRLHMDPYWSNQPGVQTTGENDISAFSELRFKTYLNSVFVPMAEYAISHGLYVVMRPPGVCPEKIAIGDAYHNYLKKVWKIVASHEKLKNNPYIMFELANEPINIKADNGEYSSWSDGSFKNCTKFFQAVVDSIRAVGAKNILWVPGLGYQSQYAGFKTYPVVEPAGRDGWGIGYAVHCYPGWYGSDSEADNGSAEQGVVTKGAGYAEFQAGWNTQVKPCAEFAPILVTEMDWAPKKYNCSWGKATTGIAGSVGFGANFRYIADKTGNVSWMLFTGPEHLAKYSDTAPDGNTFLTDPEACVRPVYRWFQEYADPNWQFEDTLALKTLYFPTTDVGLNPNIWEKGTFDAGSGCLITGQYGFGGWQFGTGLDLSEWKYLVVKLKKAATGGNWSFRVFDKNSYWTEPYMNDFGAKTTIIVPLHSMKDKNNAKIDPSHIYIVGFWSLGGTPLYIDKVYLSKSDTYEDQTSGLDEAASSDALVDVYDITGRMILRQVDPAAAMDQLQRGIYVVGGRKIRKF